MRVAGSLRLRSWRSAPTTEAPALSASCPSSSSDASAGWRSREPLAVPTRSALSAGDEASLVASIGVVTSEPVYQAQPSRKAAATASHATGPGRNSRGSRWVRSTIVEPSETGAVPPSRAKAAARPTPTTAS
jgi:hypothetical protein